MDIKVERKSKITLSDVMFYSMDGLNSTYMMLRVELDEPVNQKVMAEAFVLACGRFPYFQTKLKKKEMGFELTLNEHTPIVHEDAFDYVINATENDGFLYRFSVRENTVTISMLHGISDGAGGMSFLKVILTEYYRRLGEEIIPAKDLFDVDGPVNPEELAEPLDLIPDDVMPAPYEGSTFYHLPETQEKSGKFDSETKAYAFSANGEEIMKYAASFDGSPNALTAIVLAKAIRKLYPDAVNDGIDIGITINAKPMVHVAKSHWPFLQNSIFHFDEKKFEMDDELLDTCVRGKIIGDCTEEKLFPALAGVRSLAGIFEYIKDEKARKLLCLKSTESPRSTANVSYVGAIDFGSIGSHIKGMYSFGDSVVPLLEVNYINGQFNFTLSSRFDAKEYVEKIRECFSEMEIPCSETVCIPLTLAKGKKNLPKMGLNLATLHLIQGVSKYKKSMAGKS